MWAFDEGRFGLKVGFQRRWCPLKERPPWIVEDHYQWCWLYAAVEPATGQCVCFFLPGVDHACLQGFLEALREATGTERLGLVLDGSGSHTAHALVWPEGIVPLPLPPYSPELNPVELLFRQLRARLANRIFADLAELEAAITEVLQEYWQEPATLQQLTGFGWWLDGVHHIQSPAA